MKGSFILSCGSTVDLPFSRLAAREIPVIFYTYIVDGREYVDDMGRDPAALPRFYGFLAAGKLPSTSQINVERYYEFFEQLLQQGDLLHGAVLGLGAGDHHQGPFPAGARNSHAG